MKKILLAIAIVLTMGLGANAQLFNGGKDDFFNNMDDYTNGLERNASYPTLPNTHGIVNDVQAPLGGGLLVLTALGAGYAVVRRRRNN